MNEVSVTEDFGLRCYCTQKPVTFPYGLLFS